MPLYCFHCYGCDADWEFLQSFEESKEEHLCGHCSEKLQKQTSIFAFTPSRWGDMTGRYGVNGYYSEALGRHVASPAVEDKLCEAKGLVRVSNYNESVITNVIDKSEDDHKEHLKDMETYNANIKKYGDDKEGKGRAIAETYSVERLQEKGLLDKSIKG